MVYTGALLRRRSNLTAMIESSGCTVILQPVNAVVENIDWYSFLGRAPLPAAGADSLALLSRHRVLITGAGGSIGSALVRRVVALGCEVILLESAESNLHEVQRTLSGDRLSRTGTFYLGNASDPALVDEIFAVHRPQLVFHTAAFKYLPLLEEQPLAAIANNIFATETLAAAASRHGVRMVLLSTDKAVAPGSVMGATKYVAEQIVLSNGGTAVRLANVLGSRGSVSEIFAAQIVSGTPLTVTDREARRYFITISEAVELLLAASVHRDAGGLFVPQLTKAHSIADLARFLSKAVAPGREIPIEFTHLRPGEKKRERLWSADETPGEASPDGLVRVELLLQPWNRLIERLNELRMQVEQRDLGGAIRCLCELVPCYQPSAAILQQAAIIHYG